MDELTHRTGITATGHRLGLHPTPTPAERHVNRHLRACATMASPPGELAVQEMGTADGRHAYPGVVQYRVMRWDASAQKYGPAELVDLPPTFETHPDAYAMTRAGGGLAQATLPYVAVVHDLAAYERLLAVGALHTGHMSAPAVDGAVDNRIAPGA